MTPKTSDEPSSVVKYSIIIPTYNEENDILRTLEACSNLIGDFEVIVVDDSSDSTPEIVKNFPDRRIKLLPPEGVAGRCEARNRGVLASVGEIVIILNADVHLPVDFLNRLDTHYDNGAECVLVRSVISNQQELFARYIECASLSEGYLSNPDSMDWTEGYSVVRSIAIEAGLFPVGYPVPICAGEDGYFGTNVRALISNRVVDLSITVTHIAPARLQEYWSIRKGRGRGSAQVRRYLHGWTIRKIYARDCLVALIDLLSLILIIPFIIRSYRIARFSAHRIMDTFTFAWALAIERLAFHIGVSTECRRMKSAEKLLGWKND